MVHAQPMAQAKTFHNKPGAAGGRPAALTLLKGALALLLLVGACVLVYICTHQSSGKDGKASPDPAAAKEEPAPSAEKARLPVLDLVPVWTMVSDDGSEDLLHSSKTRRQSHSIRGESSTVDGLENNSNSEISCASYYTAVESLPLPKPNPQKSIFSESASPVLVLPTYVGGDSDYRAPNGGFILVTPQDFNVEPMRTIAEPISPTSLAAALTHQDVIKSKVASDASLSRRFDSEESEHSNILGAMSDDTFYSFGDDSDAQH
ncbi:hypothetical protein PAPHI01_1127 [Pancytospora philotis]|nr:hypothetical protein PAPHI01_1127 [Pancytospora philotis]